MTAHRPPPCDLPLHRWGSREIGACFHAAGRTGMLPEPGRNARPLILEPRSFMTAETPTITADWTGTAVCNHRRDAGMRPALSTPAMAELTANQRRILTVLSSLDTRSMPCGTALRLCVNRRRLKARAEAMQELHAAGLVNGAGSRDPWGTGNTPDSSWWWLTSAGLRLVTRACEHDAIRR
jgi:hypothetical protein